MPGTALEPLTPQESPGRSGVLDQLRNLLAEKYPTAAKQAGGILPTGLASIDAVEGGLRKAALTELSGSSGSGALFLHHLVREAYREKVLIGLVDAACSFDMEYGAAPMLRQLLTVFCANAAQAVKATDLLLRDGNLALVLLDLQCVPRKQLQRIPANHWHRLQRLVEQTTCAFVVLTPQPMVEGARVRITMENRWSLEVQRRRRTELTAQLPAHVFPRHRVGIQPAATERLDETLSA